MRCSTDMMVLNIDIKSRKEFPIFGRSATSRNDPNEWSAAFDINSRSQFGSAFMQIIIIIRTRGMPCSVVSHWHSSI